MQYAYHVRLFYFVDDMYIRFVQIRGIHVRHGCITGIGQHYVIAYLAFN